MSRCRLTYGLGERRRIENLESPVAVFNSGDIDKGRAFVEARQGA
jgi:hypothetical protein